ncbi:MAG TPA: hypothetical protein VIX89_11000 [Bryobacteraceae bacterium]
MKQLVVTPTIRRVLWIAAAFAILIVLAVLLVVRLSRDAVGFGQKCGGGFCWGYQLEQHGFSKQTVLRFTGSWGLDLRYELPKMRLERVNEDRWLAGDRAVYLNFRLKPLDNSRAEGEHVQVLYDFQRGELYVASALALWRGRDFRGGGDPGKNWLTDEEFQQIVKRIQP